MGRTCPDEGAAAPYSRPNVRIIAWSAEGFSVTRRSDRLSGPRRGDTDLHAIMVSRLPTSRSRRRRGSSTRALLVVFAAAVLSACAWFGDKDLPLSDDPADRLYNEGLFLLNTKHDFKAAAKKFEEVDRQHPYSEWARKSLIMSAYAYYESRQFDEAITSAKRYVTLHPGSPDAAYAQYLIGSSYFEQIPDISRDQGRTEKAAQALEEVARKFPNTEYAVSAKRKVDMARDNVAGKEMDIGRWYMKRKDFVGSIN